jgi:hypothetical protein
MAKILLMYLLLPGIVQAQIERIGIFKIGNTKSQILSEIKKTTNVELKVFDDIIGDYGQ